MKKVTLAAFFFLFLLPFNIKAQDTIKTIYGRFYGEVLKVGSCIVKYKPINEEKIRRIVKSDLKCILYANGEKSFFNKYQEKIIAAKDAPIEDRFYAIETVYYFYSIDGKSVEVSRTTYNLHHVGNKYLGKWK